MALPKHVLKYLKTNGVDPNLLPAEVRATLAGLSLGEVALLQVIGDSLRGSDLPEDIIILVH